ncbi:MAG: sulfur carrier protein ThiS [Legionellales bacterium]|nr:sulfur carrier protein ThiS [Legionellales bacterium]
MEIVVNQDPLDIAPNKTLANLLVDLKLNQNNIAIELNGTIVPHSLYASTIVKENDVIEIFHAVAGG